MMQRVIGYAGGTHCSEDMDSHSLLNQTSIVINPEESQVVPMLWGYSNLILHFLNFSNNDDFVLFEAYQNTNQNIGQIWTLQK